MCTLVEELSNCYDYFLRLSGFPDLFGKLFLITFNFSLFDFSTIFLQEKYFSIFNNKPPTSWVVHITRDSFTCHSCSCYSSMKTLFIWKTKHIYAKTFTVFESTLKKHCHIGQFLKFCLRQQLFAKKDFYAKSRLCLYLQNYRHRGMNQGHFRTSWQASTNAVKNNCLTTAHTFFKGCSSFGYFLRLNCYNFHTALIKSAKLHFLEIAL